jgi:hypothetical protein
MGWTTEDWGFDSQQGYEISLLHITQTGYEVQSVLFSWKTKRPGRSPPSGFEVILCVQLHFHFPSAILVQCLIKHRDHFYRLHFDGVGTPTGYGLNDQGVGVRVTVGSRILSFPRRPDRLWGPPNLLSNGYRCLFPLG